MSETAWQKRKRPANVDGKPLSEIDLTNKHQRQAIKQRLAATSKVLHPVKAGGAKKHLKNLDQGFEPPMYELEDLNDVRSEFSPEEKLTAVMAYLATGGSADLAEQFCNVSGRTIRYWKQKARWWPQAVKLCRLRFAEELDHSFTEILHSATQQLQDRIYNGDTVIQNGKTKKMPLKARDLAAIISTIFDKRAASRGDPTTITESRKEGSTQDQLENLRDTFEDFAKKWKDDREDSVIDEQ